MNRCPKCKSINVLVEAIDDKRKRVTCRRCSESTVVDTQGRALLVGSSSTPSDPLLG